MTTKKKFSVFSPFFNLCSFLCLRHCCALVKFFIRTGWTTLRFFPVNNFLKGFSRFTHTRRSMDNIFWGFQYFFLCSNFISHSVRSHSDRSFLLFTSTRRSQGVSEGLKNFLCWLLIESKLYTSDETKRNPSRDKNSWFLLLRDYETGDCWLVLCCVHSYILCLIIRVSV